VITRTSWVRATLAMPLSLAAACPRAGTHPLAEADPQRIVDELLAADRSYSAAAASSTDAAAGVVAMFADDVWMPTPRGDFARGIAETTASLRAALGPTAVHLEWVPVRGGISADGQQGFTFGYVTIHRRDTASTSAKYLSYWVRRPAGWRVVAFKLGRRAAGNVSLAMVAAVASRAARAVQRRLGEHRSAYA
jgi:ketosteroid isomerase-like protein